MLTPAAFLIGVLLAQALIMSPIFIEMPFLSRHAWLAGVFVLASLAAVVTVFMQPFAHLYWNVADELIKSTQPGRSASYSRTYAVVERDGAAVCRRELGMRREHEPHDVVPRLVLGTVPAGRNRASNGDDAADHEVAEGFAHVTKRTHVPAVSIVSERVRGERALGRFRA